MALELHNFIWEEERLVQVETQPHHLAGILAVIREMIEDNELDWDALYSAYYECEEDGTTTFYEAESAEAGSPGIWTYMVYDCAVGEETVITDININTLNPVLELQKLFIK